MLLLKVPGGVLCDVTIRPLIIGGLTDRINCILVESLLREK